MRPTKKKTPLAVLVDMLTVETTRQNRKGIKVKTRVRLSQQDVADWLGLGLSMVSSLSIGREDLTVENAHKITNATGVSSRWLLSGNPQAPCVDWYGKPYTQQTFEHRQAELKRAKPQAISIYDAQRATRALTENVVKIAVILLHAVEKKEFDATERKLARLLASLGDSSDSLPLVMAALHGKATPTKPDLKPVTDEWQKRLEKLVPKTTRKRLRHQPVVRPAKPLNTRYAKHGCQRLGLRFSLGFSSAGILR